MVCRMSHCFLAIVLIYDLRWTVFRVEATKNGSPQEHRSPKGNSQITYCSKYHSKRQGKRTDPDTESQAFSGPGFAGSAIHQHERRDEQKIDDGVVVDLGHGRSEQHEHGKK